MEQSKRKGIQVSTERGLVCVVKNYATKEEAIQNGYSYAFTSSALKCDLYSKCLDERGLYHEFVTIDRKITK